MHLRGLLDGDWELHTTNLEEMRCSRAREVLEEGDTAGVGRRAAQDFGVGDAAAAGRAAWETVRVVFFHLKSRGGPLQDEALGTTCWTRYETRRREERPAP